MNDGLVVIVEVVESPTLFSGRKSSPARAPLVVQRAYPFSEWSPVTERMIDKRNKSFRRSSLLACSTEASRRR